MAKTKKELGLDSMGVQKSMRLTDYLGDGLGQLPLNIMSCLVGQLTYFYTEKVGLAAGMVATMLLIAKILMHFQTLQWEKSWIMANHQRENVVLGLQEWQFRHSYLSFYCLPYLKIWEVDYRQHMY